MPKSKRRRPKPAASASRRISRWGGITSGRRSRRDAALFGVLIAAVLAAGGYYLWDWFAGARAFQALAEQGRDGLEQRVEVVPARGGGHVSSRPRYGERFPTSGPHWRGWAEPGVYEEPQPAPLLVHALEHGNIVVYYDDPKQESREALEDWAGLYGGRWDGLVVTPKTGLGDDVILTAWQRRLRLSSFEASVAAAFIDEYRGRGPERPVR